MKKVSLKKVYLLIGALFGVISFLMMFVAPLKGLEWKDVYFGTSTSIGSTVISSTKGAWIPFVGFILIILGAIALALLAANIINQKKIGKAAAFILLPILLGVICLFITKIQFVSANEIADALADKMELGIGIIYGAIFGGLSFFTGAIGIATK